MAEQRERHGLPDGPADEGDHVLDGEVRREHVAIDSDDLIHRHERPLLQQRVARRPWDGGCDHEAAVRRLAKAQPDADLRASSVGSIHASRRLPQHRHL